MFGRVKAFYALERAATVISRIILSSEINLDLKKPENLMADHSGRAV
jgi:glycyl-tRNA synthetase beta subunit